MEGVLSEDVSGVSNSGQAEVQAGRSSNDDVSGSGRAGESGVQRPRSMGNDTREVYSSAPRTRSDGRVGDGRLDNNQPKQDGDSKARQEASQTEINRFIDDALAQNDLRGELPLWEISVREVDWIKQQSGLDVSGLWHILDAQELKHALRKHGDDKNHSKKQAQENLTIEHLKRIPEVLRHFDEIEVQKRATNRSYLIYKKSFDDGTIEYIFETSAKKKPRLSTKTVWVVSPTAATAATQQVYTPERHQDNNTIKQSDMQGNSSAPDSQQTVILESKPTSEQAVVAEDIATLNQLKSKQANKPKEDGDVNLSTDAMVMDTPIDALMWRVNRIYDAIAEVIHPEHMARISVVTRE